MPLAPLVGSVGGCVSTSLAIRSVCPEDFSAVAIVSRSDAAEMANAAWDTSMNTSRKRGFPYFPPAATRNRHASRSTGLPVTLRSVCGRRPRLFIASRRTTKPAFAPPLPFSTTHWPTQARPSAAGSAVEERSKPEKAGLGGPTGRINRSKRAPAVLSNVPQGPPSECVSKDIIPYF